MNSVATVDPPHQTPIGALADDEAIAARSDGPLLITASSLEAVDMLARRVHAASTRRSSPLISIGARGLPCEADRLGATCTDLLQAAGGGTVLITGVEELSPMVQGLLIEMLAEAQRQHPPVRLMTGTTVGLFDRVTDGTFAESLFYRLNVIHLMAQ